MGLVTPSLLSEDEAVGGPRLPVGGVDSTDLRPPLSNDLDPSFEGLLDMKLTDLAIELGFEEAPFCMFLGDAYIGGFCR